VDAAHSVWAQGLDWLVPPLRVGLFLFLVLALLLKCVPVLVGSAGRLIVAGATPTVSLLTYPEYLTTSLCRRFGWRLLPGTFAYGQLLGALAGGFGLLGSWFRSLGQHRPALPRKTLVVVIGVLLAAWFVEAKAIPKSLQPTVATMKADLVQFDTWLSTGRWAPPRTTVANWCPPPAKKPAPKPRTTKPK
jgi:hypothetical protein